MDSPLPRPAVRRFFPLLAAALLALGGCRIEPTPTRYIDRMETPEEAIEASVEELTDRLLSTAPALQRRDLADVMTALAPHPEIVAFGPASDTALTNATELGYALSGLAEEGAVQMSDLHVDVAPENRVAWFRAAYTVGPDSGVPTRLHFSGVFVRQEGEWHLRQGHLSRPVTPRPEPLPEADSAQAAE